MFLIKSMIFSLSTYFSKKSVLFNLAVIRIAAMVSMVASLMWMGGGLGPFVVGAVDSARGAVGYVSLERDSGRLCCWRVAGVMAGSSELGVWIYVTGCVCFLLRLSVTDNDANLF